MDSQRKKEIINKLLQIADTFEPSDDNPELTMFELISQYNSKYDNVELIGGRWVRENIPELTDLP